MGIKQAQIRAKKYENAIGNVYNLIRLSTFPLNCFRYAGYNLFALRPTNGLIILISEKNVRCDFPIMRR